MTRTTRSALLEVATEVENAALLLLGEDDDTLLPSEALQIRTMNAKLNDIAIQAQNLVYRADIRRQRAR